MSICTVLRDKSLLYLVSLEAQITC